MRMLSSRVARRLVWSGVALAGLAVALFLSGVHFLRLHDWQPLRVPLRLDRAERVRAAFVSRTTVDYELRLDTERKLEFNDQNCFLGIESDLRGHCERVKASIELDWEVRSGGAPVHTLDCRTKRYGYWGPTVGRILGSFSAAAGKRYKVVAVVRKPIPPLQLTNPHLVVAVPSHVWKGAFVWASLLQAAAVVMAAGGLLALAVGGVWECVTRRRGRGGLTRRIWTPPVKR